MRHGLRASLAGAVLTAVACGNSFSSSTATDAATADVDTTDAAGDAGSTDSPPADSASSDSGASDSPINPGETGPVSSYCAMHMGQFTFCEDFDRFPNVTQFLGSWTTFSSTNGAFSFLQMDVPSPPNALGIATTSSNAVQTLVIHAMPAATGPVIRERLEFDFLVDHASNVGLLSAAAVAAILFGGDISGGVVGLAFGNGTGATSPLAAIYEGPQPKDGGAPLFGASSALPAPKPMQWAGRFAIEITFPPADAGTANAAACAQVYIGGIAQLNPCLALPSVLSHPAGVTSIALGVYSGGLGNSGSVGVGFDNVTFIGQ